MTIYPSQTKLYRIVKRTYVNDKVTYIIQYASKSSAEKGEIPDNAWRNWNEHPNFDAAKTEIDGFIANDYDEYVRNTYVEEIL
jgi:hypothetical protein